MIGERGEGFEDGRMEGGWWENAGEEVGRMEGGKGGRMGGWQEGRLGTDGNME